MYIRGRTSGFFRGQRSTTTNRQLGGDARDKLISSRRNVADARNVIRQQKVSKIGDLRAVLPRSRGIPNGRSKATKDLRLTLGVSRGYKNGTQARSKPELVYAADELPGTRYQGPTNTNVTVGRGGRVTISRQRGKSIDRDAEKVQPTGIPAHMRRQPSPPSRPVRSAPPVTQQRRANHAMSYQPSTQPPNRPPSLTPNRPQSYIVSPKRGRGGRPVEAVHREHAVWGDPRTPNEVYEYRHRSRSPVGRGDRMPSHATFTGNMRGYSTRSRERYDERLPSPQYMDHQRTAPSAEHWEMASTPVYRRDRVSRGGYQPRSLSPQREVRDQRPPQPFNPTYSQSLPYETTLRMDRAVSRHKPDPRSEKPAYPDYEQRMTSDVASRGHMTGAAVQQQRVENLAPPQQMYYCIKVTSLSHEVSEEDVVELFSDIGPLVSAKLICKGHAEVSFVHKKDAKTAIEKYDRRELDGIPMNLKLIEKSSSGRMK